MKVSPELTALIHRLAHKERSWRWLRWMQLAAGVSMLGFGARQVADHLALKHEVLLNGMPASTDAMLIATFAAVIVAGGWQALHAIAKWWGDDTARAVIELHRVVEGATQLSRPCEVPGSGGASGPSAE